MSLNKTISINLYKDDKNLELATGQKYDLIIEPARVKLLEIEDILFHHDSAVMMPGKIKESSSNEASNQAGGIDSLVKLLRIVKNNSDLRILIAGHADRSGSYETNFKISEMRAKNVLYLLLGNKDEWAKLSAQKHQIEDYQHILAYFSKTMGWDCDPSETNNQWSEKTYLALKNFIVLYNFTFLYKPQECILDEEIPDQIKKSNNKLLPIELWRAIFDLFNHKLILTAFGKHIEDNNIKSIRENLKFVDPKKPYVSCGESFPISENNKKNYRSQKDRRVEILLFNKEEIPVLCCPSRISSAHKEEECPVYNKLFYEFVPVDLQNYLTATYHLKFIYFNKIAKTFLPIPQALQIKAFKDDTKEIPLKIKYDKDRGIYELELIGVSHEPREEKIHFAFSNNGLWIYTKNSEEKPKIVSYKSDIDPKYPHEPISFDFINSLPIEQRECFYDLPKKWDSRNWLCSLGGTIAESSENLLKLTSFSEPIIFNLDAIVLTDKNGNQNILDTEYDLATKTEKNVEISTESKIAIFYLDHLDNNNLKIYNEHNDFRHYSDIELTKNFIIDTPPASCRLVYFNNSFYDVTYKRTEVLDEQIIDEHKKFVCGARAAILEDEDVHVKNIVCVNLQTGLPSNDYAHFWAGNYELHYLDNCGILQNKPLSYLLIYWNCRLIPASKNPASDLAISDWLRDGMINSMEYCNRPYIIKAKQGSCDKIIKIFHYFEAKPNNRNGRHKCLAEISTDDGDWMLPEQAKFCDRSYTFRPGYYGPDKVEDVDGTKALPLMSAHEMGHATGLWDDYLYNLKIGDTVYYGVPGVSQPYTAPGGPYNIDNAARMKYCRLPRMRDMWHYVNWINDNAKADKPLYKFLNGSVFKMYYSFTNSANGSQKTIDIDLSGPRFRDTCKPSYKEEAFKGFSKNPVSVYLYYLGGGETAETIMPGHLLNAICVVSIKVAINFGNLSKFNTDKNWFSNRRDWIKKKLLNPIYKMNKKYYIYSQNDNLFKKTLLAFTIYFTFFSDNNIPTKDAHFAIFFDETINSDIVVTNSILKIKQNVNSHKIIRYFFGLSLNSNEEITAQNLFPLSAWMGRDDVAKGIFTIKEF
jgi:outer membrane protein OmpA-like peptidoglycan-associated protein